MLSSLRKRHITEHCPMYVWLLLTKEMRLGLQNLHSMELLKEIHKLILKCGGNTFLVVALSLVIEEKTFFCA